MALMTYPGGSVLVFSNFHKCLASLFLRLVCAALPFDTYVVLDYLLRAHKTMVAFSKCLQKLPRFRGAEIAFPGFIQSPAQLRGIHVRVVFPYYDGHIFAFAVFE